MISLLIVAHAPLASALRAAVLHSFPEAVGRIAAYDVPAGSDTERYDAEADALLASLPGGDVMVLTDLVGSTPGRLAERVASRRGIGAIAGVNLMMLMRAMCDANAGKSLPEAFERAQTAAAAGIVALCRPAGGTPAQVPAPAGAAPHADASSPCSASS